MSFSVFFIYYISLLKLKEIEKKKVRKNNIYQKDENISLDVITDKKEKIYYFLIVPFFLSIIVSTIFLGLIYNNNPDAINQANLFVLLMIYFLFFIVFIGLMIRTQSIIIEYKKKRDNY